MGANPSVSPLSIIAQGDDSKQGKSPYTNGTLNVTEQSDLSILVHFVLLFRRQLDLSAFELLDSKLERSLLHGDGRIYVALILFFSRHPRRLSKTLEKKLNRLDSTGACEACVRLKFLRELADNAMDTAELREAMMSEDGRVLDAARLRTNVRDGNGNGYTWLRGSDGCFSDRILMTDERSGREVVMRKRENVALVKRLEKGGKRDFVTAGWLRGRIERAGARGKRAREVEEERVREEERREVERREREEERMRKLDRVRKMVGVEEERFGRGKREKKRIYYEEESGEEEDDDKDEEFSLGDDGEGGEGKGESEAESEAESERGWEQEEEDEEKWKWGGVVAVGRARVFPSGRTTRNSRKAGMGAEAEGRPVRKCRRLVRNSVCEEAE